jgi:hypothetical protein
MKKTAQDTLLTLIPKNSFTSWPTLVGKMAGHGYSPLETATALDNLEGTRIVSIDGEGIKLRS